MSTITSKSQSQHHNPATQHHRTTLLFLQVTLSFPSCPKERIGPQPCGCLPICTRRTTPEFHATPHLSTQQKPSQQSTGQLESLLCKVPAQRQLQAQRRQPRTTRHRHKTMAGVKPFELQIPSNFTLRTRTAPNRSRKPIGSFHPRSIFLQRHRWLRLRHWRRPLGRPRPRRRRSNGAFRRGRRGGGRGLAGSV